MMLTLGLAFWITSMLVVLFFLISLLLMLIVLIQRPQGGGLSGAFGAGAGSGQTAFGVKTGDALTWATIVGFALFLGMAIALNYAMRPADVTGATRPAATAGMGGDSEDGEAATTPAPQPVPVQPTQPEAQPPAEGEESTPAPETPADGPADAEAPTQTPATPAADEPAADAPQTDPETEPQP